jgi:hypothetical protein
LSNTSWPGELGKVVDEVHRSLRVPAGERQGRYDDVAAVTLGDPTLAGVIARWKTATAAALTPQAGAASSRGVQMAAVACGSDRPERRHRSRGRVRGCERWVGQCCGLMAISRSGWRPRERRSGDGLHGS